MAARRTNMELNHFDRIIAERDKLKAERDDLARQLGDITQVVATCKHLPQRDTIAETIRAANDRIGALASSSPHPIAEVVGEGFKALASHVGISKRYEEASRQRVTPMSPRALASIIKDWCYRRAKREAAQDRQETFREVARAMGAEEAFEAMVSLVGAEKTTPECFAEMLRMCAASSPAEVALQFKVAKVEHPGILFTITEGDPFAGIMDGPEMMPTWDGPSDLGEVRMSAHCEGDDECPSCGSQWFIDPVCGDCDR